MNTAMKLVLLGLLVCLLPTTAMGEVVQGKDPYDKPHEPKGPKPNGPEPRVPNPRTPDTHRTPERVGSPAGNAGNSQAGSRPSPGNQVAGQSKPGENARADARKADRDTKQAAARDSATGLADKPKGNIGDLQRDASEAARMAGYDNDNMQPSNRKDRKDQPKKDKGEK